MSRAKIWSTSSKYLDLKDTEKLFLGYLEFPDCPGGNSELSTILNHTKVLFYSFLPNDPFFIFNSHVIPLEEFKEIYISNWTAQKSIEHMMSEVPKSHEYIVVQPISK